MSAQISQTIDAVSDILTKEKEHEATQNHITPVDTMQNGEVKNLKLPVMERVDKFGAHAKTDPREIKLVKKLDWYIMVSLKTN
jgi:hypothetical protein